MDIELGSEPTGISAGRAIKEEHGGIGMIVLSSHKEREYLSLIAKDEFSGWSYLLKQTNHYGTLHLNAVLGLPCGTPSKNFCSALP